jgi:hypothetical protein
VEERICTFRSKMAKVEREELSDKCRPAQNGGFKAINGLDSDSLGSRCVPGSSR